MYNISEQNKPTKLKRYCSVTEIILLIIEEKKNKSFSQELHIPRHTSNDVRKSS